MTITSITPNGNIAVLSGVPLDNSYTNTLSFGDAGSQHSYFASKAKFAVATATPVRMQNRVRIPWEADSIYDCNYIMFQNTNFGAKWFYAFITEINYINPNCTEIGYELDVMQTWYFDYKLNTCFVEREHTLTDNVGEHLIAEPWGEGEQVSELAHIDPNLTAMRAVLLYAPDAPAPGGNGNNDSEDTDPFSESRAVGEGIIGGLFTALTIMSTPLSGAGSGAMLDLLHTLESEGKANNVVATYIMPNEFYTTGTDAVQNNFTTDKNQSTLGSYTPRNKKLLSYPYNFLRVDNSQGQSHDYRYEYFSGSSCSFLISCAMGTSPEVVCAPRNYNSQLVDYAEVITLSGYPQFSWACDTYRNWLAINGNKISDELWGMAASNDANYNLISGTSSLVSTLGSLAGATGGPRKLAGDAISGIADSVNNNISTARQHLMQPNQGRGSSASATMVGIRAKNFYFAQVHVREDYAKVLDGIFDIYGYQVDALKVPNTSGRPSWNYVKTRTCNATGSIPFNDLSRIKAIYNKGITFWHGDYVGDYSRNNSV